MSSEFRIYSTKSELKKILKNLKDSSPSKTIPLSRSKTPNEKHIEILYSSNGKKNRDDFYERNKKSFKTENKSVTPSKVGKSK